MTSSLKRLFVNGFPSLYGGAGTELHHQILLWRKMAVEVHLILTGDGFSNERLYLEMVKLGVIIHVAGEFFPAFSTFQLITNGGIRLVNPARQRGQQ